MTMKSNNETLPEVFIIESLDDINEDYHQYEGETLCNALRLAGKNPKYYYFKNVEELNTLATLFDISNYRYLHISCHGDVDNIPIGDKDLTYDEFFLPWTGKLQSKRLFMSACRIGNDGFAEAAVESNNKIHSIVAPCDTINFDVAMAFWMGFYIGCFNEQDNKITNDTMIHKIKNLERVFNQDIFIATVDNNTLNTNIIKNGCNLSTNDWIDSFAGEIRTMERISLNRKRRKLQGYT